LYLIYLSNCRLFLILLFNCAYPLANLLRLYSLYLESDRDL